MIIANGGAAAGGVGSGRVIDGDGETRRFAMEVESAKIRAMLVNVAALDPQTVAGSMRCPALPTARCRELLDLSADQRLAASRLAVEGARLALSGQGSAPAYDDIKLIFLRDAPTALDAQNRPFLVNARNNPDDSTQIEMAYAFADAARRSHDYAELLLFEMTLIHEYLHRYVTASLGARVLDYTVYSGLPGRDLINRAAADIIFAYLEKMPPPTGTLTVTNPTPSVFGDIDGKPSAPTLKMGFTIRFTPGDVTEVVDISISNGGSFSILSRFSPDTPGGEGRVQGEAVFPMLNGNPKISARLVNRDTGQASLLEQTLRMTVTPATQLQFYRFRSTSPGGGFSFSTVARGNSAFTLEGAAFQLLNIPTRLCRTAVYLSLIQPVAGQRVSVNAGAGSLMGYGCDPVPGVTFPLHVFESQNYQLVTAYESERVLHGGPNETYEGVLLSVLH